MRRSRTRIPLFLGAFAGAMTGCAAFLSWDLRASGSGNEAGLDEGSAEAAAPRDVSSGEGGDARLDALHDIGDGASCVCISATPPGWTGPWIVTEQSVDALPQGWPPPCADGGAASVVYGGLDAAAPSCSCTCAYATGAQCDTPTLAVYSGTWGTTNCDAGPGGGPTSATPIDTACTPVGTITTSDAVVLTSSPVAGSCEGIGGQPSPPPARYATTASACPAVSVASVCGGNDACIVTPQGAALCVAQDAKQFSQFPACPPEFPNPRAYALDAGVADTRDCTACTCDVVPDSCAARVNLYADTCSGGFDVVASADGCTQTTRATAGRHAAIAGGVSLAPDGGSCVPSPSAGKSTGAAAPSDPVTYCCR